MDDGLAKTLAFFRGNRAELARACGVSRQTVARWRRIPPEHCTAVEAATRGAVTRLIQRPDIFGPYEAKKVA